MPSHHFSTNRFEQNLVYLDDYLDTLESLPAEMQRSFTLMQQLDASAQEKFDKVAELSVQLIEHIHELSPEDRVEQLKKLSSNLSATGKFAEERVSLATSTYDTVDRHIRRLDDDLQKFEDEQMTGPGRINSSTTVSSSREEPRKQAPKNEKDKKEIKSEKRTTNGVETNARKKSKTVKDTGTPPPSKNNGDKEREKTWKGFEKERERKEQQKSFIRKVDHKRGHAN
ncbi:12716_t:CDS:1, partial [Acaulospora colombiana]